MQTQEPRTKTSEEWLCLMPSSESIVEDSWLKQWLQKIEIWEAKTKLLERFDFRAPKEARVGLGRVYDWERDVFIWSL